uniref:A disintegrin and metallopeptidase domain 3-like n=1 Tax=Rhinolophus ferrumequinum TaxID=59479 RepID=A0A671DTE5_RHIFE
MLSALRMLTHVFLTADSETSLMQITVPQKIGTNTNNGDVSETHVTYAIEIDGKTYTLHLEKQSFLDPHFRVYSYNKSGALYPDSSFIKGHCFYQGYAAEIPKSAVTLSICSGLRGLLQLENVSYGIEPLDSATTYEHMLYQIKNNETDFLPLQGNYPITQLVDQSYKILVKSEVSNPFSEISIFFDYMGSEVAVATENVVHIFSLINTMFSQLKVTVKLTSLELWSDQNKIPSDRDANEVLQRFVSWKEKFLFQRSHDMAFLLIYRNYPNYVGATYHGMACDPKLAAGIALYPKRITLEAFSVVLAQLLGINLGLTYDDIYSCYCPGTTCIMNPQAIRSHGVRIFSSCSMDEFKGIISQPEFECLQNQTISKVIVQGRTLTCGNRILEPDEECDCGPPKKCSHKKCCNPETCTLIRSAECGTGPCCDKKTCMVSERGYTCRISKDACDFTEFCNGNSEYCPQDVTSLDFEPCHNKTAYCYKGICRDPDQQCAELFGKFAKASTYLCSEEVNFLFDDFGNCDRKKCNFGDILCGKVVCHWTHSRIVPRRSFDIQYTYLGGHICMSAYLRNESVVPARADKTYVYDGTLCDFNKVCKQGTCQFVSDLRSIESCDSMRLCKGHGVCNSKGNCHCDVGYAPPSCTISPSSPGGSIDDGFWILVSDKSAYMPAKQPAAPRKNGVFISFGIFLPFLILIAIIALKWNKITIAKRIFHISFSEISLLVYRNAMNSCMSIFVASNFIVFVYCF